jgi:type II secretory pathway pseudopilin PulG
VIAKEGIFMVKFLNKPNENGFATVIVIVVVVVMGILLAGLIPLGTTVTQSAAYTRNTLQAQYIAEAGAKRAIAELQNGSTDWDWVGSDKWHDVVNNPSVDSQYSVSISPELSGAPTAGTYTVNSTGNYGKFSKKVTVTVTIGSLPTLADFTIGGKIDATNSVELDGNISILVGETIDSDITLKNGCQNAQPNKKITIPPPNFDEVKKLYGEPKNLPIPPVGNEQNPPLNANTVYWHEGDLNFTYDNCGYKGPEGPDSGYAIVAINGDLTWDAIGCNMNGNILFLINGKFIRKSGNTSFSSCCFYCNEAEIYGTGSNFSAMMIVRGDIVLESSLTNINSTGKVFEDLANDLPTVFPSNAKVSGWAKGACTN